MCPTTARALLPEHWVCLLMGVEPKDTTKPKIGRRKDPLLAASKENTGNISQSSVCPKTAESFKLRAHAYSFRGLRRGEFSVELGPRSIESKL